MRIVFMGTPSFSAPSLRALADRHAIATVVTRPDAVSSRGAAPAPSPVKSVARDLGLPVLEATHLRDADTIERLRDLRPDAICVVAYGAILPQDVLDIPRHGCINAHASLLPRHRGAAPIERAILAGDEVTGVSVMRMDVGLDTGPVSLRLATSIGSMDASALSLRLSNLAADALVAAIDDIEDGRARWFPQDEGRATYAHKVTRDDVRVAPELDVTSALRRIRASSRRATTRVRVGDAVDVVLISAASSGLALTPGEARITPHGPALGLVDGSILVTRLKPSGKREMTGAEFACGVRLPDVISWSPL